MNVMNLPKIFFYQANDYISGESVGTSESRVDCLNLFTYGLGGVAIVDKLLSDPMSSMAKRCFDSAVVK